jgi:integrase
VSKRANRQGSVRRRGKTWFLRISTSAGKRVEIRTEARTRSDALDLLGKRLAEMNEGRFNPDAAHTRIADLYADLKRDYEINGKRVKDLEKRWAHLDSVFGGDLAVAVSTPRIRQYIETRLAEKAARGTVALELAALRRMFRLGAQADKVVRVPHFPTIRLENARTGFFERSAFEKVRTALPVYLRPLVTVAFWMGWRKGELLRLERRQVDLTTGRIVLDPGTTKNREGRIAYLPPEALAVLREAEEKTTALERERGAIVRHVFHRDGAQIKDFNSAWRSACDRAGHPGMIFHDFRRTAARDMVRRGVHEGTAMKILGHKTRSIFDRYNITSEDDLREAASGRVGTALGQKGEIVSIDRKREQL